MTATATVSVETTPRAKLADAAAIRAFALAGHARFTLVSQKTGARYTYEVLEPAEKRPGSNVLFVRVLTGQNNEADYSYLGCVFDTAKFVHGRKSHVPADAPSAKAFVWAWPRIVAGVDLLNCEVWHEGRCGRCGRVLTVPESITNGIGPVCAEKGA